MGLDEILYLRFANTMLEPIWNRNYVASRADHDGRELRRRGPRPLLRPGRRAARRRRQPPDAGRRRGRDGAAGRPRRRATLKDAMRALFRAIRAADPAHYVRGQYDGYRDIDGVAADSTTETYAALRLEIDNWRWSGVPFFIRTGKRLPVTQTEVRLVFQQPAAARLPRLRGARRPEPDQLVVKLDPTTGVRLLVEAQRADAAEPEPITLDMEFADEGGEGPTPYEVLLHAAMRGDATRFTRQDGVEETWRIMQPLLDAPPPVHPYAPGSWGPEAADRLRRRPRRLARPVGGVMTATDGSRRQPEPQSAAAPSPFPPIADYALPLRTATPARWSRPTARSTGCACRASTRRACSARCSTARPATSGSAPFGINVPAGRALRAGHEHRSMTTWQTPTGWVVVRDALTMGPRARRGHGHAAHAAAGRRRRRPHAGAHGRRASRAASRSSSSASRSSTTAARPASGRSSTTTATVADATGAGVTIRLRTDMALGIEGDRVRARHVLREGERLYCALSWAEELGVARRRRRGATRGSTRRRASGAAGWRARGIPDHRWREPIQRSALTIKGLTYMPTGATVAALTTSLPETPGGERNWDYRYTWMRDSTFTLQALHWLNLDWEADEFMQFVADLEPNEDGALQIMYGIDGRRDLTEIDARRPLRLRRRAAGADRQRRLRPAPERRLRRRARLDPAAHPAQPAAAAAAVADRPGAGRVRDRRSGASPTRASGRRAASRSTTCRRSSCAGSRWTARPSSPRSAATPTAPPTWRATAEEIRADILEHGVDATRRAAPALRHRRARRLDAAGRDLRLPARRRRAAARDACWRSPTS